MTLGVFAGIIYLSRPGRPVETVDDLSGLARSHPITALLLAVCLLSLTGLPPTAGFWGKFNLFLAAWGVPGSLFKWLAVLLAINAAIAGWYYLRIVGVMFLRQPIKPLAKSPDAPAFAAGLVCAVVTLGLFFAPAPLWREVEKAVGEAMAKRSE
jgi:NADH-quinone oxidoreductase subunit N